MRKNRHRIEPGFIIEAMAPPLRVMILLVVVALLFFALSFLVIVLRIQSFSALDQNAGVGMILNRLGILLQTLGLAPVLIQAFSSMSKKLEGFISFTYRRMKMNRPNKITSILFAVVCVGYGSIGVIFAFVDRSSIGINEYWLPFLLMSVVFIGMGLMDLGMSSYYDTRRMAFSFSMFQPLLTPLFRLLQGPLETLLTRLTLPFLFIGALFQLIATYIS